jgi:hypothetical protein
VNTSADRQGAEEKNRHALDGGFFSYQSFSVIPNPSLTFVACDIIDICI